MTLRAFINCRLLDPKSGRDELGTLLVEEGLIKDLGPNILTPKAAIITDCNGEILCPGIIDMQSFATDGLSAAKGGITTAVLMPDFEPIIENNISVEYVLQKTNTIEPIKFKVFGAATKGLKGQAMAEMGLMAAAGALGFTDPRFAVKKTSLMRRILEYASGKGYLITQHIEDPDLTNDGVATEGETATRMGLPSTPLEAEVIILERDLRLLELTSSKYHAAQVTTSKALDVIRDHKIKGKSITCGTSPQYFALNESAIIDYRTFAKVSPPLRSESDRVAVVEGLKDGTIDVISSNHDPRSEDLKKLPFEQAAPGIVGYETLLPLVLELHHSAGLSLITILKTITSNPAKILGLEAGELKIGYPADIIIFNPDSPWRIETKYFLSEERNSPFDNRPVQGRISETIIDGKTVYRRKDK